MSVIEHGAGHIVRHQHTKQGQPATAACCADQHQCCSRSLYSAVMADLLLVGSSLVKSVHTLLLHSMLDQTKMIRRGCVTVITSC